MRLQSLAGGLAVCLLLGAPPGECQALCGDCNRDGVIDILDALREAQFSALIAPPSPPQPADFEVCDVNNSTVIDIIDALLTAQVSAQIPGIVLTCPQGCQPGNTPPVINVNWIPMLTQTECRTFDIPYNLQDADSNLCSLRAEFSTSAGATWSLCTEGPGSSGVVNLTATPAGVDHVFVWASDDPSDLGPNFASPPTVLVRMTPADPCGDGNTDQIPIPQSIDNTNGQPIAVISNTAPPYAITGTYMVNYWIFDNESDVCRIIPECSTDAGNTWTVTAQGAGGDPVTGLSSGPGGVQHTYAWDVDNTFPAPWSAAALRFRITPVDCGYGLSDTLDLPAGAGCLPGNTPPAIVVNTPLSGLTFAGSVSVDYDTIDLDFDLVTVQVDYSTSDGATWAPATQGGGDSLVDQPATPGGLARNFVWSASADLPGGSVYDLCRLRFSPSDMCAPGTPTIEPPIGQAPFTIGCPPGQTSPPTVTVQTPMNGQTFTGGVTVDYTVLDADSHAVDVLVEFTTNASAGNPTWTTATLSPAANPILGIPATPGGTAQNLVWETATDIPGALETNCALRFTPSDLCDNGAPVVHPAGGSFTVDNSGPTYGPGFFVCNSNQSRVYFVSTAAPTVISDTIQLPAGSAPFDAVIDPVTQARLYVLCENSIYIIDANSHAIIDANPGGGGPNDPIQASNMTGAPCAAWSAQQMEIHPNGQSLFMNVYNCSGGFVLIKVSLAGPPYPVLWSIPQGFFGDVQGEFALSPDGSRIVTCNNNSYDTDCNQGGCPQIQAAGCLQLTCLTFPTFVDCCNTDSVSFVNADTGTIINTLNNMGNNPLWASFNAAGTKCYVSEFGYLDLCVDPIFCDLLGEEVHRYDTSGATMTEILPAILVPCPACGNPGSAIQEGSFPAGVYRIPGLDRMYVTDPANEAGNVGVLNTVTDQYESTAGQPLQVFTPQSTGFLFFAPHHMAFDSVRNLAYVIEFDQANSRVRAINYSVSTYGALDITKDTSFGDFGPGGISGIAVKEN